MVPVFTYSLSGQEVTALSLMARGLRWHQFDSVYRTGIGPFARRIALAIISNQRRVDGRHLKDLGPVELEVAKEFISRNQASH